jgi:hypothetical protein
MTEVRGGRCKCEAMLVASSLADDFGVGGGGDDADDAGAIEVDVHFEVFGFHAALIEFFAVHILAAERIRSITQGVRELPQSIDIPIAGKIETRRTELLSWYDRTGEWLMTKTNENERRGAPRAVLLSLRDYVRLSAPEPDVLKAIGRGPRRRARTSSARGKSTRLSGRLAPDERSANDPALDQFNLSRTARASFR